MTELSSLTRVDLKEVVGILTKQGYRLNKYRYNNTNIIDYLDAIEPAELAKKFMKLHNEHDFFEEVCAGAKHHHVEVGGLVRHVQEMIGFCLDLTALYPGDWEGKVDKSDIIIACYLHDFSKVWHYEYLSPEELREKAGTNECWQKFKPVFDKFKYLTEDAKLFIELAKYGIILSEKQAGAIIFAEGGYSQANFDWMHPTKTSGTGLSDNPLATLTCMADVYSAFILGRNHR